MLDRLFLSLGAASGALAVAAGAFGAHALKTRLTPDLLAVFEVAVRYQMYHALALLAVAAALGRWPAAAPLLRWAGGCFAIGSLVFCGSLYLLVASGVRGLGAVTPVGGVLFIAGWVLLALAPWRAGGR